MALKDRMIDEVEKYWAEHPSVQDEIRALEDEIEMIEQNLQDKFDVELIQRLKEKIEELKKKGE